MKPLTTSENKAWLSMTCAWLSNKTLRKTLHERPERLEPATLSFTGKCVNQWAMRNFNKCWWKYEAFIGKKSQWKTSGERAVVMKSQHIRSKFGYTTKKILSPESMP